MRAFEIATITDSNELGPAWQEIVEGRELEQTIYCEFGFAEEVITLLAFKDGSFEVGIGESLRPYDQIYVGDDEERALTDFLLAVKRHVL